MTSQFSAEEWTVVSEAPVYAGARVIGAESGGSLRERFAIKRVYEAARELRGESSLLDALVASPPSLDLDRMQDGAASNERLRAALAVVGAKGTPEDLD